MEDDIDGRNQKLRKAILRNRLYMAGIKLSLILLILGTVISDMDAISYRCENNQILIVQNFGNDTIRMHCQRLNLCGNDKLQCNYDHEKATCGGKNNFVSHVNQLTPTGNVNHTCCELQNPEGNSNVPGHDGNDCFVYELPDGSSSASSSPNSAHAAAEVSQNSDAESSRRRRVHSIPDSEYTVLQNAEQIPAQFDGYVGYRMKLFLLKNKSPPTLVVKAIERVVEGYRVTICRPRCGKFNREADVVAIDEKTIDKPDEWAAASWSSWTSSTWTTWSTTTWNATDEASGQGIARRNSTRGASASASPTVKSDGLAGEAGGAAAASANASANSTTNILGAHYGSGPGSAVAHNPAISQPPTPSGGGSGHLTNNININATGGHSGGGGSAVGVGSSLPGHNQATAVGINGSGLGNSENGATNGRKIPESNGNEGEKDENVNNLLPKTKGKGQTGSKKTPENDGSSAEPEEHKIEKNPNKNNVGNKRNGKHGKGKSEEVTLDSSEERSLQKNANKSKPSANGKPSGNGNEYAGHGKKRKPHSGDNDNGGDDSGSDDNDGDEHGNGRGGKIKKGKGKPEKGARNSNKKSGENEPNDLNSGENEKGDVDVKGDKGKMPQKKQIKGGKSSKGSPRGSFENSGESEGMDSGDEKAPKERKNKKDGEAIGGQHPKGGKGKYKIDANKNNQNPSAKDGNDSGKNLKDGDNIGAKSRQNGSTASPRDHNNEKNNGSKSGNDDDEKKKAEPIVKLNENGRENGKELSDEDSHKKGKKDGEEDKEGHGKEGEKSNKNKKPEENNGDGQTITSNGQKGHETEIDGDESGKAVNNSEKHGTPATSDTATKVPDETDEGDADQGNDADEAEKNDKKLAPDAHGKNANGKKKGKEYKKGNGDDDESGDDGFGNGDDSSDDDDDGDDVDDGDDNKKADKKRLNLNGNNVSPIDSDKADNAKATNPVENNVEANGKVDVINKKSENGSNIEGADNGANNGSGSKKDVDGDKNNNGDDDDGDNDKNGPDDSDDDGDNVRNESGEDNSPKDNAEKSSSPTPDDNGNVTENGVNGEGLITVDLKAGLNAGDKKVEEIDDDGSGDEDPDDDGSGEDDSGSGEGSGETDGEEISVSNKLGGSSGESGESGEHGDGDSGERGRGGGHGGNHGGGGGGGIHAAAPPVQHAQPTHTASGSRILRFQPMANADPAVMQRSCFSADTLVKTISGEKPMSKLEVGDLVLVPASGNLLKFERVEMFYHREPETYVKFIQIETESGKSLSLTPLHLMPFGKCSELRNDNLNMDGVQNWLRKSRFAHKASLGDCILSIDSTGNQLSVDKITRVGRRYSKGIYSPMTVEGSIITNGVLSSCFSQIESHAVQKIAYDVIVRVYSAMGYLTSMAEDQVQEIPKLLDYVHNLSRYVLPFAKY